MRKIIDITQDDLITCDNPKCDYKIKNETGDPNAEARQYINMPCPKCGENLLTETDYSDLAKFMKYINWINKWFGWLIYFLPKKESQTTTVHVHEGIKIKSVNE